MVGSYFVWDVNREILHIAGPLSLRWYSLLFLSGILLGNTWFLSMMKKEGRATDTMETLLYYIVIGTVVGARLGHCLFYDGSYYLMHPLEVFAVWEGGLASHGGYLGVVLAIFIFARRYKDPPFLWLIDRIAIAAVMAGGFIRLGNLFNSEIIGKPTDVPWAIIFQRVDSIPRHPTQIYESLGYFSISLILYVLYRLFDRKPLPGRLLGAAMALAFTFRALIEVFKENQVAFEDGMSLNMGQWLSFPFILFGILLILGIQRKWVQEGT